mgnify:CR=1 FL=1
MKALRRLGVMPMGADSVVVQEVVRVDGERITVPGGLRRGQNVRRAGEDLAEGGVAIPRGKRMGPAELGLAASLGLAEVAVTRRLRVAFFSTGDELASIGRPLAPGEVYDSNRYTLHGALARLGCELIDMGVVPDRPDELEAAFLTAAGSADVVLTTGGVSVGEADFIRDLMQRLGEVGFWKIDIKPGRPMAFGRIGKAWMFGLPGNPVAVMVTFYQFVQDALLKLSGVDPLPERPLMPAVCVAPVRKLAVTAPDGRSIDAWLVTPPGLAPGQRAPLILAAIEKLVAENARDSFTAAGSPAVGAVSEAVGFKVQAKEIATVWQQYHDKVAADKAAE